MFVLAMPDSRKTPPFGQKRRLPSQDDNERRDAEGYQALRDRESARQSNEFSIEEYTDQYEGPELEERRESRQPMDRIRRLERKHDELKADLKDVRKDVKQLSGHVADVRADVAGVSGKLDGQDVVLSEMLSIVKKSADRDHVTFTAKVEVDKAQELAKTEVAKAAELALVEVSKEKTLFRRRAFLKGLGIASGGAGIVELLHRLGVL